jgi:hypothetical protein
VNCKFEGYGFESHFSLLFNPVGEVAYALDLGSNNGGSNPSQDINKMIFPLFIIPLTTLIFINFSNVIFKASGFFHTIKIFGSNLSTFVKIVTLASLHINLIYALYL